MCEQFGVPTFTTDCRELLHLPLLCDVLNNIVDTFTYDESVQKLLSFLQYWKDPYKMSGVWLLSAPTNGFLL